MDSQEKNINTWQVMKNLSKVWESLLTLESAKRAKSWNIGILLDPNKLILFQNINIPVLFPHCSQNKEIQVIWAKFMDIIGDLKLVQEGILQLHRNIKSWFEHFLEVYQAKDVTP